MIGIYKITNKLNNKIYIGKRNGLINEGCIDYLREGEYRCY